MRNPSSLQTKFLIELFKALPEDVIVRAFAEGLRMSSADGTREVVIPYDHFEFPANTPFSNSAIP
jgi:hypothetical protein